MTPSEYSEELADLLEMRDVPREAVAEIVREVESHALDSGEDPVATFGTPAEYADNFAPRQRMTAFWTLLAASVLLASGGTWLLIRGVFALSVPTEAPLGLPAGALIGVGAAGIIGFAALIIAAGIRSRRRARSWRV